MTGEEWLQAPNEDAPERTNASVLAELMVQNGGFVPKQCPAGINLAIMQQDMGTDITQDENDEGMGVRCIELINDQLQKYNTTFAELLQKDMQK